MSDFVRLETDDDKTRETMVLNRLNAISGNKLQIIETPVLSAMDAFISKQGVIRCAVDVKVRKPSAAKLQTYSEGLWMKARKVSECVELENLLKFPMFLLFAFDNGHGEMWVAQPSLCTDLTPVAPRQRIRPRNLSCDDELIVHLDWKKHLERIA